MVGYDENHLPDLLPLYYKRLFPHHELCCWLSLGMACGFTRREISFTYFGEIYKRYQSFDSYQEFVDEVCRGVPIKIDLGAVYRTKPKDKGLLTSFVPIAKEMVFDIDLTDYDEVRTCCSGATVCSKCWKFMVIAGKIIDAAIKEDFGYNHILWVFSGRRGIHAWVCDEAVKHLDDFVRSVIADYLNVFDHTLKTKKVVLLGNLPHCVKRALNIIDQYFVDSIVKDQDILGTESRMNKFLELIDENIRHLFKESMSKVQTSVERWDVFLDSFRKLLQAKLNWRSRNLVEEIKLQYCYPRLDAQVTLGMGHLLKSPFCVHPKTGKVCVPFKIKHIDSFDPNNVPTISLIMSEVDAYDRQTKLQEEKLGAPDEATTKRAKIKEYKKTSLSKAVKVFIEFIWELKHESKSEHKRTRADDNMEDEAF